MFKLFVFVAVLLVAVGGLVWLYLREQRGKLRPLRPNEDLYAAAGFRAPGLGDGGEVDVTAYFDWVNPTLAIGSYDASTPPQCWTHFDAILNLTTVEHQGMDPTQGAYLFLPFVDSDAAKFEGYLDQAVAWLQTQQEAGHKTLVHCAAGASRSVCTVLAHLCEPAPPHNSEAMAQIFYEQIQASRAKAYPSQLLVAVVAQRYGIDAPQIGWVN